jgi:hypothetical protein
VLGGHLLDGPGIAEVLRAVTGRRLPVLPVPGAVWRGVGRLVDFAARVVPIDPVFTHEAMVLSTRWEGTADDDLGIGYREPVQTFRAAVEGLVRTDRLSPRAAGAAA